MRYLTSPFARARTRIATNPSKFALHDEIVPLRPTYVLLVGVYLAFAALFAWGAQLSFNMYSIARVFARKKEALRPGNVKEEVVLIQKLNESKARFKEQLRLESRKVLPKESRRNVLKMSSRRVALVTRNIGNHSIPPSRREVFSIRQNMREFALEQRLHDPFGRGAESRRVPVSMRKNDVLFISARDFGKPGSRRDVRRFNEMHYADAGLEESFEDQNDPNRTDDEQDVDELYRFQVIAEEDSQGSGADKQAPRVRKHSLLAELRLSKRASPGLLLDGSNGKESLKSECYRTPRNASKRMHEADFLRFSPKGELDSIREIVDKLPRLAPKKEPAQSLSGRRVSLERSFKFDCRTDDEGQRAGQSKTSESLRQLQNNIKMEFLEEIKFGSSILKKGSVLSRKEPAGAEKSPAARAKPTPLASEVPSEAGDFFKKKKVGSRDLKTFELNMSYKPA